MSEQELNVALNRLGLVSGQLDDELNELEKRIKANFDRLQDKITQLIICCNAKNVDSKITDSIAQTTQKIPLTGSYDEIIKRINGITEVIDGALTRIQNMPNTADVNVYMERIKTATEECCKDTKNTQTTPSQSANVTGNLGIWGNVQNMVAKLNSNTQPHTPSTQQSTSLPLSAHKQQYINPLSIRRKNTSGAAPVPVRDLNSTSSAAPVGQTINTSGAAQSRDRYLSDDSDLDFEDSNLSDDSNLDFEDSNLDSKNSNLDSKDSSAALVFPADDESYDEVWMKIRDVIGAIPNHEMEEFSQGNQEAIATAYTNFYFNLPDRPSIDMLDVSSFLKKHYNQVKPELPQRNMIVFNNYIQTSSSGGRRSNYKRYKKTRKITQRNIYKRKHHTRRKRRFISRTSNVRTHKRSRSKPRKFGSRKKTKPRNLLYKK